MLVPLELVDGHFALAAFDVAYQRRPEMKGMELYLQALKVEKKVTTTGLLFPELSVGAYAARSGGLFEKVPPADPDAYPNPDVLYPTEMVNISLVWRIPLGRLIYAGELKRFNANLNIQQTQIEQLQAQINEEIISAREQLTTAKKQIEFAKEGSELAGEALRQSLQRQELGTVLPFEILQTQEIFIQAHLDYLRSIASYNKAQYRLWVAMGNNL